MIEVIQASKEQSGDSMIKKGGSTQNPFKTAMRRLRPTHANQKLVTSPTLEDIYMQLYRVLNTISIQFLNIPTVHESIYKFANIGKKTFLVSADLGERKFDGDSIIEDKDGF